MPITFLHLSDIHIKTKSDANTYLLQVETDLFKQLKIPGLNYMVISGDIADYSTNFQFQ